MQLCKLIRNEDCCPTNNKLLRQVERRSKNFEPPDFLSSKMKHKNIFGLRSKFTPTFEAAFFVSLIQYQERGEVEHRNAL